MNWPTLIQKKKKNPDVSISLYKLDKPIGTLNIDNNYNIKPIKQQPKKKPSDDITDEYWDDAYIRNLYGDK